MALLACDGCISAKAALLLAEVEPLSQLYAQFSPVVQALQTLIILLHKFQFIFGTYPLLSHFICHHLNHFGT